MRAIVLLITAGALLAQPQQPPAGWRSVRLSGATLGKIRLGAADEKIWFGWNVAVPSASFKQLTFSDAVEKADALFVANVEGFDTQRVSPEIPKKLDWRLQPGERAAVVGRMREFNLQMPLYRVENLALESRKVFDFAKSIGVKVIVTKSPGDPAEIDKLAEEFGVNVAIDNGAAATLAGRSKRIGLAMDLARGAKPSEGLMAVTVRDGGGPGAPDFFLAAFRMELKPLYITVDSPTDLGAALNAWDKAMQPAMTARVRQVVDSPAGAIRGPDRLPAEMRQKIDAAIPREALAKPKKPRKLLVVDLQMYSGHGTIPHGNLLIELFAKYTGVYTPIFSNDLENLKYPKIKEFDAIFLNSVVGMVFPDPEVRAGLLRYVREGGGLGGIHGTTYAALDWPEFTEMLGGSSGQHHSEKQVLKIDDPSSPLNAGFGGQPFEHTDEFYHFPARSPYTREKQHILLSIDVEKSDMATSRQFCAPCTRPDQDYGMSWIKSYGKGRVFCTPLGHTPILFTTPAWTRHLTGALQYILGDLDLDATPSAKLAGKK